MDGNRVEKFTGTLDRIRILDLVQVACLGRMNADVEIESDLGKGVVGIRSGQVVNARTGALSGEDAVLEILLWQSGHFTFTPQEDDVSQNIRKTWEQVLFDVIRNRTQKSSTEPDQGYSGRMAGIDLIDLVQLSCITRAERILQVEAEKTSGTICFDEQGVVHAECGELKGLDAFLRIMLADEGSFESMEPQEEEPSTIQMPWDYLLIEATRHRDEQSGKDGTENDSQTQTLIQKIQKLKVAEKIKLAMTGDKEARNALMRDANRMVQLGVISNPRLTEGEVALIAGLRSIDEEVLRRITTNREWMRLYQVRLALVTNPKCPLPISTKLMETLGPLDWRRIAASKSVPTPIAQLARKLVTNRT